LKIHNKNRFKIYKEILELMILWY